MQKNVLNISCGAEKIPGSVGIEIYKKLSPDILHDLNQYPYPIKENVFNKVCIKNVLFLLNDPISVMEEVYRLCKNNAKVIVVQPYFRSVCNHVDPYLKSFGTVHSISFFDLNDLICKRYDYSIA